MAKPKESRSFQPKLKRKRPGRHSKKRSSKLKTSKLYMKRYAGQG